MTQNAIDNTASSMDISNINIAGNTISSTDTDGNVVISPDGTGIISATKGISFDGGTNSLSFYEEGTWTPGLTFGGGAGGISYSTQGGVYTRIGNICYVCHSIQLTSKGGSQGIAELTGLPFTVEAGKPFATSAQRSINIILGAGYFRMHYVPAQGSTTAFINESGGNLAELSLTDTSFTSTSNLSGNFFYFIP